MQTGKKVITLKDYIQDRLNHQLVNLDRRFQEIEHELKYLRDEVNTWRALTLVLLTILLLIAIFWR
jgi:ABC-type phosphate transport system auxiliary subunit